MESFPNMQSNEEKSLEKSMDEYLKSLGYHRKKIAKDGSCLFRAVAEQVLFCQSQHTKVRATCVDYLKRYRENYEAFIEGDFEEYLLKLEDPQHWVGEVEISALALMYRRDFIIFQDVGKQPVSITNNGFEDKVRLCFLNGNHYDSVYPISRVKTAAYCQSLLYGLLYEQVCGVDHSIVSNGLRGNRGNNPLSDDVMEPCRSSDESDPEGESTSWSSEGAGNSGLRLNGHPHKGRGRARLPERVRRSLNPNLWRNVEYDLWLKSNMAQQKMDFRIAAGMQYTVGDMCQVCLEGRRTYSAYIHEVKSDSGPVTVFIKELGERHTVDLCRLRPPSGENSWSTVAREGRSLGEWETRGGRRRPSHSTTQGISQTIGPAPPGRVMKQSSCPPQAQSTGPASVFVLKEEQLIAAEEEEQNLLQLHDQESFPALGAPAGDVQIQTGAKGASPPPSPPAAASTASPTAPKSAPAVSVAPLSAPAVSTAPLSALAISVAPLSAPAVSTAPLSSPAISTAPLSASAVSTAPLSASAVSAAPISVSAAPLFAPALSTAPISVSTAPLSAPAVSIAPISVSAAPLSAPAVSSAPISVSAAPLSAPAVSTAPLYAPAVSAAPLSAPAVSAAPLSAPAVSAAPLSAPAVSTAPLSAPAVSTAPLSAPAFSAATLSAPPPAPTHSTSSVTTPEYVSAPSPPSPNTSAPSAPTLDPSNLPSPVSSVLSPSLDAPVTSPSSSHTAPSVLPYTALPQDPLPSESCLPGVSQPPPGLQQFLKDPLYPGFPQGPEGEVVSCPPYCLLQSGEDLPRDISIVRFFYNLGVRAYSTPTYLPYHYLLPLQQAFSLQPRGPPPAPLLPPWCSTSSPHQPPSSLGQYENIQAPFSQAPDPPQQSYSLNAQTHPRTGVLPWPPSPRPYSAPAPAPSYPPPLYTPQYPPPNYIPTSYSQNTSYYPPTSLHLPPTYPRPVPPGDSQNQGPVEVTHPASGASPPGHRVGPGPLVDGRGANSSWYEERGQGDGGTRTGSLLGEPLLPVSGPSEQVTWSFPHSLQTPVCRLPQFKEVSVVMTTQGACNGPLPMATSEMHRSDSDLTRTYQPTLDMLKGVGPLYAAPPLSHSGSQLEEGEGLESSDCTFRGARIMYSRSRGRGRGQDGNRVRGSYRGRRGSYDDRDRRYDGSHDRRYGEYTFKATPILYQDRGRGRGYSYYPTNGRDAEYLSGHRNGPYASS